MTLELSLKVRANLVFFFLSLSSPSLSFSLSLSHLSLPASTSSARVERDSLGGSPNKAALTLSYSRLCQSFKGNIADLGFCLPHYCRFSRDYSLLIFNATNFLLKFHYLEWILIRRVHITPGCPFFSLGFGALRQPVGPPSVSSGHQGGRKSEALKLAIIYSCEGPGRRTPRH